MTVLINLETLVFLKATEGEDDVQRLEIWGDILAPVDSIYITGTAANDFIAFSDNELKILFHNAAKKPKPNDSREKLLSKVAALAAEIEIDTTPKKRLYQLLDESKFKLTDPTDTTPAELESEEPKKAPKQVPKQEKAPIIIPEPAPAPTPTQEPTPEPTAESTQEPWKLINPQAGRPKAGSTTAKVWDVADNHAKLYDLKNDWKARRAAVIAECEAQGINKSTAATQLSRWKKANNA